MRVEGVMEFSGLCSGASRAQAFISAPSGTFRRFFSLS
jgi:hypothetical protein